MYQQLKQDEPSNGPHNRTVLAKMPKVYHMPGKPKSSLTYYQVFQGPGATFNVTHRQGPRLDAIPDGPGNTILISESREPAAWADAQDLPFRGGKGVPLLTREQLGLPDRPFQVIMFDGTVRLLSPTVDPQHLTWAVMPDDAQELPDRWWEGK